MLIRNPSDLGALIRERRTKLGLDQISLAKKAGTSRKWLIEVENGKPRAEIGLIFRTLKALGLTLTIGDTTSEAQPKRTRTTNPVDLNQIIDSLKRPR
jgi:HTH-type transcriptional regulator/antitoxin HipB